MRHYGSDDIMLFVETHLWMAEYHIDLNNWICTDKKPNLCNQDRLSII